MIKIFIKKDFEKSYFLTSDKLIFHRYCDSGFKTKWTGLWYFDEKFLEYFAFKINGEWLSPNNISSFEFDSKIAIHYYQLKDLFVKEFLTIENSCLKVVLEIQNNSEKEKDVEIEMELAVNFRKIEKEFFGEYKIEIENDKAYVFGEKKVLGVKSFPQPIFIPKIKLKEHYPGERQICFLPFNLQVKRKILPKKKTITCFLIVPGFSKSEVVVEFGKHDFTISKNQECKICKDIFYVNDTSFLTLYNVAKINLNELFFSNNVKGIVAGLPWFVQLWARDSFISLPSLLYIGEFQKAKQILITFLKYFKKSLPHLIKFDESCEYKGSDSELLFLIALEKYVKYTADIKFLQLISKTLNKIFEFIDESVENSLFLNKQNYTWMDTLDRTGFPIELEAVYSRAMFAKAFIKKMLNENYEKELIKANEIKTLVYKKFVENQIDRITLNGKIEKTKRVNFIFLPYYNVSSFFDVQKILKEMETPFGLATLSPKEKNFNPKSYHEGSSWVWINLIYAQLLLKNGYFEKAYSIIERTNELINKNALLSLPECIDPFNGENLGALKQAWSAAMAIETMESGLIGFEFNAITNSITISPYLKSGMRIERKKILPNDEIFFEVSRKDDKYMFSFESKNKIKYKINFKPRF